MNLRVDTTVVRDGGTRIQTLAESLASTMSAAESDLRAAAENVGQPAMRSALEELLDTLMATHPRVTMGIDAFAREVQVAGEVFEQVDVTLAADVPEAT